MPSAVQWSASERRAIDALVVHVEPSYRSVCQRIIMGDDVSFAQAWQAPCRCPGLRRHCADN